MTGAPHASVLFEAEKTPEPLGGLPTEASQPLVKRRCTKPSSHLEGSEQLSLRPTYFLFFYFTFLFPCLFTSFFAANIHGFESRIRVGFPPIFDPHMDFSAPKFLSASNSHRWVSTQPLFFAVVCLGMSIAQSTAARKMCTTLLAEM